ncbi:hypothetical protein D9M71_166060 [compost metagenome]
MPGCCSGDGLGGDLWVFGHQAGDQAAFAACGQGQGFVEVVVGHQGADRAERLDVVSTAFGMRVAGQQQGRGEEGTFIDAFAAWGKAVLRAEQLVAALQQAGHAFANVGLLIMGGQGTHAYAFDRWVADHDFGQALAQAGGHRVDVLGRNDGAADGGALLPGLGGHFTDHFLDVQVELFIVRADVRAEDGAVQRVGLGIERHRVAHQVRVDPQLGGGVGRACEGDEVLALQAVEQVAGAADHQLQAAGRQQAGLVHHPHHGFGQVAGGGGWLDDARHAGEEARCEFLQHAPDREVEGVDVHDYAAARHQDVAAGEFAQFAQGDGRAFVDDVARWQLTRAQA